MSVTEQLSSPDNKLSGSMEDAIKNRGIDALLNDGVYRPDVATEERMRQIQVELAKTGIPTTLSSIYRRGDSEPLSYELRRINHSLPVVAKLDDYRK